MNRTLTIGLTALIAGTAHAQTVQSEIDALSERLAALEEAPAAGNEAGWTDTIKIKGDLRYRYEYKAKDSDTNKSRHRFRARIGAYADVNDQVQAGIRIATGSSDSPTSTNQDIDGYASQKEIWLDRAYLVYSPDYFEGLNVTLGKMAQPWVQVSDLMFDGDMNPEGIAADYTYGSESATLQAVLGYHIMDENVGNDVALLSAQLTASAEVASGIELLLGAGAFAYSNIDGADAPGLGGNTGVSTNEVYRYGYEIVDVIAKADVSKGPLPFYLYAEYLKNIDSDADETAGYIAGIGTKAGRIGLDYSYRSLDEDAVLSYLADGDFGGTGTKGHKLKLKYSAMKNLSLGMSFFRVTDAAGTDSDIVQADVMVKF